MERKGIVTFHGNGMTLVGTDIKPGDAAPEFAALNGELAPVRLADFKDKIVIISSVPSLDTPVCELQTKRFNDEAAKLKAAVITISMDLPFAQKRFCDSFNVKGVTMLSDFRDREFSHAFGLYIKELGLIARAVYVIDAKGRVAYREIVSDISNQPDYDKALAEAKRLGA